MKKNYKIQGPASIALTPEEAGRPHIREKSRLIPIYIEDAEGKPIMIVAGDGTITIEGHLVQSKRAVDALIAWLGMDINTTRFVGKLFGVYIIEESEEPEKELDPKELQDACRGTIDV